MERYQDYVIKDGEFVGKFEEMYQKFDNPWHQIEATKNSYARHAALMSIKNHGIKSLIEIGCGLGVFTNYLAENLPGVRISGMDVSDTAVRKAKETYQQVEFICGDIKKFSKDLASANVIGGGEYEAILFAEIMWYILEDLDEIIENISANHKGRYVIINQTFYKGQQKYGKEYFTTLNEMVNYLPWENLAKIEIETSDRDTIETHSMYYIPCE